MAGWPEHVAGGLRSVEIGTVMIEPLS